MSVDRFPASVDDDLLLEPIGPLFMQVKAHVTDVHQLDTDRGHRLYTVFRTLDGCELGVWLSDPTLRQPEIGEPVFLKRDRQGSLHFNPNSLRR